MRLRKNAGRANDLSDPVLVGIQFPARERGRRREQRGVMKVDGRHTRSIWLEPDGTTVSAIDQRRLPHHFVVERLTSCDAAADAIKSMLVRGAPLIGATAAFGMALAMRADPSDAALDRA